MDTVLPDSITQWGVLGVSASSKTGNVLETPFPSIAVSLSHHEEQTNDGLHLSPVIIVQLATAFPY